MTAMPFGDPTPEGVAKNRAWREGAAKRYADRRVSGDSVRTWQKKVEGSWSDRPYRPNRETRRKKPPRNDGPWRKECEAAYGTKCVVCGDRAIEMDHIKPRAQGGKSVVENGLPLCGAWSRTVDGGHHGMKTRGEIQFRPEWLRQEQRAYLARIGWVDWDEDGKPFGEGWRHFTERTSQ